MERKIVTLIFEVTMEKCFSHFSNERINSLDYLLYGGL
jgi:hypothetical protein